MIIFQKAPPTKDNGTNGVHGDNEEDDEVISYKPKRRRTLDLSDSDDDDPSAAVRQQTITGNIVGAQWFSGRVLDSRPRDCGFEPHRRHGIVSLCKTH